MMLLQTGILLLLLLGTQGEAASSEDRNTHLQETNATDCNGVVNVGPYIKVLRGRDGRDGLSVVGPPGRDGKDGEKGETGEPGIQGPPGSPGTIGGGVVYTRWGRTTCPEAQGTELLYDGITAGSAYNKHGGGVNYLCLPHDPEYSAYRPGDNGHSELYGTEYETGNNGPFNSHNHNAPCAVCYIASRVAILMLPAKLTCPPNWTLEYNGYLMSEASGHPHSKTFECIDMNPESIPGSSAGTNGALLYFYETSCNGIPCPPYDPQKEVVCAVCSK